MERRDGTGRTVRRTLGTITGRHAITDKVARDLALQVSSEIAQGVDRLEVRREQQAKRREEVADDALTLAAALREYVEKKRRGKDGLPLKDRTRADYLAMLSPPRDKSDDARAAVAGELHTLAAVPLARITADDIRAVYAAAAKRGQRRATYAAQVLRAVLNWHGVKVPDNPLSKEVAGRDRIMLKPTTGNPQPIPPERLPAWWNAASTVPNREGADLFRVMLLTGMRPGEVAGLKVADVDLTGGRVHLADTKNRKPHTVYLSRQAADVLSGYVEGRKRSAPVFTMADPRKTLKAINEAAGVTITPHDLRKTFASVAEEIVSAYALKAMLNHAHVGDVTGAHYVAKSESQLRKAWQDVADAITGDAQ